MANKKTAKKMRLKKPRIGDIIFIEWSSKQEHYLVLADNGIPSSYCLVELISGDMRWYDYWQFQHYWKRVA